MMTEYELLFGGSIFQGGDVLAEAEIFQRYLKQIYGKEADYLETKSTNCGNNITYLLELLEKEHILCKSIILSQDATMQRRMDAGMRKFAPEDMKIINFATYQANVAVSENRLIFREQIKGMWDMEHYISLLMGEIGRLTDDENGYGPKGKDFIAHTDIPQDVQDAFFKLKKSYGRSVRLANPEYAS